LPPPFLTTNNKGEGSITKTTMADKYVTFEDVWEEGVDVPEDVVEVFKKTNMATRALSEFFNTRDGSVLARSKPLFAKLKAGLDTSTSVHFTIFVTDCGRLLGESKKRKYEDYRRYQQDLGMLTPSGFGQRQEWPTQQADPKKVIMCGRPAGGTADFLNICIMHPVFQKIVDAAATGEPAPEDFELAGRLTAVQPNAYTKEGYRRDMVNDLLNEYIASTENTSIAVKMIAQASESDGTSTEGFFNVEYKGEKGEGNADPYMENASYFTLFWGIRDGPQKHCCPWLLMEVVGQEIGLSGGVFACDFACVNPLTSNVPFLQFPQNRRMQMVQARLCMALRVGFRGLASFYRDEVPRMTPNNQAGFPHKRSFELNGKEVCLKYESLLNPALHRPIFCATREDTKEVVVVKFAPFYGHEVHKFLADQGLAPVLYSCAKLGDLFMVVMQLCEGAMFQNPSSDQKALLTTASRSLAGSGLVHGDLRPPNIMLVGSDEVKILDFDWAGKAGEARYPIVLSEKEPWHQGAGAGKLIETAHDQHMVSILCSSSN